MQIGSYMFIWWNNYKLEAIYSSLCIVSSTWAYNPTETALQSAPLVGNMPKTRLSHDPTVSIPYHFLRGPPSRCLIFLSWIAIESAIEKSHPQKNEFPPPPPQTARKHNDRNRENGPWCFPHQGTPSWLSVREATSGWKSSALRRCRNKKWGGNWLKRSGQVVLRGF